MSREHIEHETLAAFLDGKLDPAERERVVRILAEHPEEYEVFADAARVAAELRSGAVVPIESRRRPAANRWLVGIPVLVAAGLAAIALVPGLIGRGALTPVELAGRLTVVSQPGAGSLAAKLGASWDQPGWSVMRGSGAEMVEPARAFRLGARATDVEVAIRAGDSTALATVGAELVELLGGVDAGAASAAQYRAIMTAGPGASGPDRKDAAEALRALLGKSVWFDAGAWVEAARVAALAGNQGGLRSISASLRGISDRVGKEEGELRDAIYQRLQGLEPLLSSGASIGQNRQGILEALSQIIVAVGR